MKYVELKGTDKQEAYDLYADEFSFEAIDKAFHFWSLQGFKDLAGNPIPKKYLKEGIKAIFENEKNK